MKIYNDGITAFKGAEIKYKEDRKTLFDGTADQIAVNEILLLQLRAAHAVRNDGYAKTAANKYVTNLGALQVHWVDKTSKEAHGPMQEVWEEFSDNPMLDGYGNLYTWQSLSNYTRFLTGANFTRLQIRVKNNPSKIPLKLESINPRLHDIGYFGKNTDNTIKFGIKFKDTKPLQYYFRLNLFEDFIIQNDDRVGDPTIIPADELIHSFIRTVPGQWIGIPELAAVLIPLYRLDDLTSVTVAKQAISQAITIIVSGSSPLNRLPVGGIRKVDPITDKELIEGETSETEEIELRTKGTNVLYPKKGENISVFQGADIGNNLLGLIQVELRKICNALDVPYHQVTGDLTGIDFSSLRSLMLELRSRIEYIHHFYTIPLELKPLTNYFKKIASLHVKGIENVVPTFQLPIFRGIDDLKDAQADKLEMETGFGLLKDKLAERHITFEQLVEDLRLRKQLKEEFDFDLLTPTKKAGQEKNVKGNSNSSSL